MRTGTPWLPRANEQHSSQQDSGGKRARNRRSTHQAYPGQHNCGACVARRYTDGAGIFVEHCRLLSVACNGIMLQLEWEYTSEPKRVVPEDRGTQLCPHLKRSGAGRRLRGTDPHRAASSPPGSNLSSYIVQP